MNTKKFSYPLTAKVDQTDDYFGTKINDPYRWLENDISTETEAWVQKQNEVTNNYLKSIPSRDKIKNRLTELWNYPKYSTPVKEGEWFTYYKNDGLQNQAVLYIQKGLEGTPEVLLDPNRFSKDGTVALQSTGFSKNQKFIAYAVSALGSDWQEIYIMDPITGKTLDERLENIKFTGISWKGDEGFYYSGYDKPGNEETKYSATTEFQKLFFHKIGTQQASDILIYEDPEHPLRYISGGLTEDERFLVLNIAEGTDGCEIKICDLSAANNSSFITIVPGFHTNANVIDNIGGLILLQTNNEAPNFKIVLLDPIMPSPENWILVVPEQNEPLETANTGGGKLFASYLKDACTRVFQYSLSGKQEQTIELPGVGTASGFGCKKEEDFFFYNFTSFTSPNSIFKYDIQSGRSELYKKSEVKFDPEIYETKQVFYAGKDGTKIPMFITARKGLLQDGNNPTLLYAYGGFNINLTPAFSITIIPFLESGGIYCVANIRGGGEYGETWHRAGMLENKQNVFDDFIAAAEWLIEENYTSPGKLAIRGGSNGGLLVGACMTQRPGLFKVALPQVGVLDMLRYHKFTVGFGWVVEYGSSDNEAQFNTLIKYSPLHNIKSGTCYPATLVSTADHDDRVVPAHSFKFSAALQAAQSCDNPVLIRIDSKSGHGAGKPTSKIIDEAADTWSFILHNLGVDDTTHQEQTI